MTSNTKFINLPEINSVQNINNLSLGKTEFYIYNGTGIYLIPGSTGFPATQVPYVMALIF